MASIVAMTRGASIASRTLLAAVVFSLGCGPVHKELRPQSTAVQKLERLAVRFAEDGEFTVIDERAQQNTALAAFGLVGLVATAVQYGTNASSDNKSAESLAAFLESAKCRDGFQTSFEDTLRKAGKPTVEVVAERPEDLRKAGFDAVLEFSIEQCGFRMTNRESEEMGAFVELRAKLVQADGKIGWDDRETIVATTRASLNRLRTEPDLARTQFETVLRDAGRRMANNTSTRESSDEAAAAPAARDSALRPAAPSRRPSSTSISTARRRAAVRSRACRRRCSSSCRTSPTRATTASGSGTRRHGYGQNKADIVTLKPVTEVGARRSRSRSRRNGHKPARTVRCASRATSSSSGSTSSRTLDRGIHGHRRVQAEGHRRGERQPALRRQYGPLQREERAATRARGRRVMNLALARLVESIAMDDALTQALSAHQPVATTQ